MPNTRTLAAILALSLAGCSLASGYPGDTAAARRNFEAGRFAESAVEYNNNAAGGSELLYRLEAGAAFQAAGRHAESKQCFEAAEKVVEAFDWRPNVSGQAIAEGLGTAFLNDLSLPYDGAHYERVLLNTLQSINYWMEGDVEGALVEVRRALLRMEDAEREGPRPEGSPPEHVFAQYYAGALRELTGDLDGAYVDYKKTLERSPGLICVKRDLLRIAKATGRTQDWDHWRSKFAGLGPSDSIATSRETQRSEIVVLFLAGMAPQKKSVDLVVPTGHSVTRISIPEYVDKPDPVGAVRLVVDGHPVAITESIDNASAAVRAELERKKPALVAKTVARATARAVATEIGVHALEGHDNNGIAALVAIVAGLFSTLVEEADLRSWLTLPRAFQVGRAVVTPGMHDVRLELLSAGDTLLASLPLGMLELRPNVAVPVYARSIDRSLFAHPGASGMPDPEITSQPATEPTTKP
jgi:hypothetical protein